MLGWMRQMGQGRHRVRKTYNTDTAYRAVTQLILLLIFNTLIPKFFNTIRPSWRPLPFGEPDRLQKGPELVVIVSRHSSGNLRLAWRLLDLLGNGSPDIR